MSFDSRWSTTAQDGPVDRYVDTLLTWQIPPIPHQKSFPSQTNCKVTSEFPPLLLSFRQRPCRAAKQGKERVENVLTWHSIISQPEARDITGTTTESVQLGRFLREFPGRDLKALSVTEYAPYVAAARGEHRRSLLRQVAVVDGLFP